MSALELSLAGAALLIGLTGAWSPCGFSMVETVGLSGDGARRPTVIASCATFAPGAALGGVATFGLLAVLGDAVHGAAGETAYLLAAAVAVAAAVAEARGVRIVPQIRRQLPEGWRWTMPLPLAAALYGVLLGLAFTTFVLSFGVWALAGISLALGDPHAGLVIGIAFGIGRSIPVLVVAPLVDRPLGIRYVEAMAERPALYRMFRLGDAATLCFVAAALTATATATAARTEVQKGADPSAAGKALAFQRLDRTAALRFEGHTYDLPGKDPAVGGPYAAVIMPGRDQIEILNRYSREVVGSATVSNAQAVAISKARLAYLAVNHGRYALKSRRLKDPANPGEPKALATVSSPSQIGHPSIYGGRVFYALSKPSKNAIKWQSIKSRDRGTVVKSRTQELLNPTVLAKHVLYERVFRERQSPQATSPPQLHDTLMVKRLGSHGFGHEVYDHGPDHPLWTTARSGDRIYVTILGSPPKVVLLSR
jgi:hypothetical protein